MARKPAGRIAAAVAEKAKTYRSRQNGFFHALPPEHREELLEAKRQFIAGVNGHTATVAAKLLHEACQENGIKTCGPEGLREWLIKPLESE
jgi:hypothetical protein